jgi:hypothetical protein
MLSCGQHGLSVLFVFDRIMRNLCDFVLEGTFECYLFVIYLLFVVCCLLFVCLFRLVHYSSRSTKYASPKVGLPT